MGEGGHGGREAHRPRSSMVFKHLNTFEDLGHSPGPEDLTSQAPGLQRLMHTLNFTPVISSTASNGAIHILQVKQVSQSL